jgi:hypothetical protein
MSPVRWRTLAPVLILALVTSPLATPALAQNASEDAENARRPAIVLGGPSVIGVLLPLNERWALRPDASLLRSKFTVETTSTVIWSQGIGLSVIRNLSGAGNFDTYIAPRVGLARIKLGDGSNSDTWIFDIPVGIRAPVASRVDLFGEAGLRASRNRQPSGGSANTTETAAIRSAIGVNIRL